MFKYGLLSSTLVLILFQAACGPLLPAGGAPQPLPSPGESWTVKLTQSGGFAGVLLTVEVSSNGQLKAEDARSGRSVTKSVPPETLAQLVRLYARASIATPAASHSGCADCFLYDLELSSGGRVTTIHADDTTLADSGAADLIALVRQLRDQALKSAP